MIGLDTNVIVRYIMQDDAGQAAMATELIESLTGEAPGFITLVSIVELVWVLSSSFKLKRAQIVQVLEILLQSRQLMVDQAEHVVRAVRAYASGDADFADCLIERTAAAAGCTRTVTFDVTASKSAGMVLIN
jgi:predicted nucleic-acid-binding protein